MTIPKGGHDETAKRRERAEEIARGRSAQPPQDQGAMSLEETRRMLHELQVHQIELELQNEELREAQATLEASQARYFDLYDLAPVSYCTLDEKGLILEANLNVATRLGVARQELVKQPISRFILKEDQDTWRRHREDLFETGAPLVCEIRMVKKDGTVFWAHLDATPARDPDGVRFCRIVMSDITERKRAEVVLQENQRMLRSILDTIPQSVFWKDANGIYLGCNRVFASAVGLKSPDEIVGKTDFDLPWPRAEVEAYRADDEEVISSKAPKWHIIEQGRRADGTRIWADTSKLPLLSDSGSVYVV